MTIVFATPKSLEFAISCSMMKEALTQLNRLTSASYKRKKGTFEGYPVYWNPFSSSYPQRSDVLLRVCVSVGATVAVDLGRILICHVHYIV